MSGAKSYEPFLHVERAELARLSGDLAKLVSGFFRLRDLGPFDLKGVSAPIRVYELEGVSALHTPIEVSRSRGFSRFVGKKSSNSATDLLVGDTIAMGLRLFTNQEGLDR
jgi:hypothetical protein